MTSLYNYYILFIKLVVKWFNDTVLIIIKYSRTSTITIPLIILLDVTKIFYII